MSRCDATELERLRYWQGQMLRSRDFRDQLAIEAQLRAWHNRALHNTFGVSLGLVVSPMYENNHKLKAVRVSCGLAYDCFGRELILQEAREIPVPSAPQGETSLTLLIRYKETSRFPKRGEVEGGCLPGPCSPFGEELDFIWKPSGRVEVVDGVPLARVTYDNQNRNPDLDKKFLAPISRPLARPHIASGATIQGATAWETWSIPFDESQLPLGFRAKIDTSAAGFTDVPCYFAWLQGLSSDLPKISSRLLAHFEHLDEISASGFTFNLLNLFPFFDGIGLEILAYVKQRLFVCWLGIQPVSDFGKESHLNEVNHVNS